MALTQNSNGKFNPADVQVKNIDGKMIYLNQIVTTTYQEEEVSSFFRINGLNSIYLSFTATDAANRLKLSQEIQAKLAELQANFPAGYEIHLLYDESEYLQQEMNKIYFRSGLTVLILLVFVLLVYRNLKYSLVILLSLLANIGIAAICYYLLKIEMQLYSLAGLTISLTIIIDNAIIMADQMINRGNRKSFLAILTATVTSIFALIVILFMDEKIRANLQDFAMVIVVNLVVSLFVALFLVPALLEIFNIKKIKTKRQKRQRKFLVYFNRIYRIIILFIGRFRTIFIVLLIFAFGLPVFLLPEKIEPRNPSQKNFWADLYNQTLGSTFYKEKIKPVSDIVLGGTLRLFVQKVPNGSYSSGERSETTLFVTASLPYGSTKEQMDNIIKKMERYITQFSEVRQFETQIESGKRASIRIYFVQQHQRSGFPYRLKSDLISKGIEIGGGSWGVYGFGDGFSNDVKEQAGSQRIKLLGYNYDELTVRAEAMRDSLLQYRRIKEVTIDSKFSWYKDDYTEFTFTINRERLAQENLYPSQILQTLTPLFARNVYAGDFPAENRTEPIRLYSKQSTMLDIWNMEHVAAKSGENEFRINEIGRLETSQMPSDIAKENQQYLLCVQFEYIGAYDQARKVTEREIDKFNDLAPLGYKAETETSRYWWGDKDNSAQYMLLLLIIVIIYFTTSILFNSMKQPLTIIAIIPLSYIGLFLTFYLFKLNFDQGGYAAFILLTGISVNANIYLLNEYNNVRRKFSHLSPLNIYLKAWNVKVRPVFLTVISTVLGFIPFIVGYKEAFWYPLAAGSMGGLIFSFLIMFLFLPLMTGIKKQSILVLK
ncbi:MAG: efflux RND transporter permease subunit [Bacteroidales bacterium]|nr:efflux RND transporter permease subunit [Bacteroidales bacterium]